MLQELKLKLDKDLYNKIISPSVLLDNLIILNEQSRKTSAYVDPNNIPFYYYLGKHFKCKNLIEIGTGAALNSCCYFKGCKDVENFLAYQNKEKDFYSSRFAIKNINKNYKNNFEFYYGNLKDDDFNREIIKHEWDLVLFNENKFLYDDLLFILSKLWLNTSSGGLFVVNHLNSDEVVKNCFYNFCKIKNSENIVLNTRYGIGIIEKD